MAIWQNCGFDDGGRRSWRFPKKSKTLKIVNTSLYLPKKTNFIEFRVGMPKKSHFEVGDFSKISDFQGFPRNFRTAKSQNPRKSVSNMSYGEIFGNFFHISDVARLVWKMRFSYFITNYIDQIFCFFDFLIFCIIFRQNQCRRL